MTFISISVAASAILYALTYAAPNPDTRLKARQVPLPESFSNHHVATTRDTTLEQWLSQQEQISIDKLLANVAPGGSNVPDAANGSVIASPSKEAPNYYYQWVRDAAITMQTLVDHYAASPTSELGSRIETILNAYIPLQSKLQHTDNPSGNFGDLSGLGEPKFMPDGSPFTGSWGRPQSDGPALRTITLAQYLAAYNASHPGQWDPSNPNDWFKALYTPSLPPNSVIKADLEYVSHFWQQNSFDLWEEVNGTHFFTVLVQLRSLQDGANVARLFGDASAAQYYDSQAAAIRNRLPEFWNANDRHLIETLKYPEGTSRNGLDCGLLLGALHANPNPASNSTPYPPYSDEILLSLYGLVEDQRRRFPINSATPPPTAGEGRPTPFSGTGVGRYPEDVYDGVGTSANGGNPWFLCTTTAAQTLYHTAQHMRSTSSLAVTDLGLFWWQQLLAASNSYPDLKAGSTYDANSGVFKDALARLVEVGDQFMSVVRSHANQDGALSEQFDKNTGFERGARDLTWSYGAFLSAVLARKGAVGS